MEDLELLDENQDQIKYKYGEFIIELSLVKTLHKKQLVHNLTVSTMVDNNGKKEMTVIARILNKSAAELILKIEEVVDDYKRINNSNR